MYFFLNAAVPCNLTSAVFVKLYRRGRKKKRGEGEVGKKKRNQGYDEEDIRVSWSRRDKRTESMIQLEQRRKPSLYVGIQRLFL
jgi:hypothetical protein